MNSRDFLKFWWIVNNWRFCIRIVWKNLSMGYRKGIKWDMKYWNTYYCCVWWNFAWKRSIWTTRGFWILRRNCLMMRAGGYVFYRKNWLSTILKSILENFGYGVDLARLWRWITLCLVKRTFSPISFYHLIENIWRWWQVRVPWRLVRCDRYKSAWSARNY